MQDLKEYTQGTDSNQQEELPLFTNTVQSRKKRVGLISFMLILLGVVTTAVIYAITKLIKTQKPTKLTFSFDPKKNNAAGLIIHNQNEYPVEVIDIQFTSNVVIDTTNSSSVYGDLAPNGASIEKVSNDQNLITYKLREPSESPVVIEPNASKNFTYLFTKALGIVDVGIVPSQLALTTTAGSHSLGLASHCNEQLCDDPFKGKIVGGYYTDWDMYARQYNAKDIPTNLLNTIYYAFIKYTRDGGVSLADPYSDNIQLPALMQMKEKVPYLKVLLSFGGYSSSSEFPYLAQDPVARANFAQNVLVLLQQFKFSGIDLDWEYPNSSDSENFYLLLRALRDRLNASGQKYLITLATSAGEEKIAALGNKWPKIAEVIDYINLMAYDFNGPWSSYSDYQSPLRLPSNDPNNANLSIEASVKYYQKYNFPKDKIVLGMPAYFRGVKVSNMQSSGMWQPVTGTPGGQYENGIYDYVCAISKQCFGGNQMPQDCTYLDEQHTLYGSDARTPSIACAQEQSIFTGDSTASAKDKSCFALNNDMKGIFFWALAGDERKDPSKSLLLAAGEIFRDQQCPATQQSSSYLADWLNIKTKVEWQLFVQRVQLSLGLSYFASIAFTLFFQLLDKITNELIKIIMPLTKADKWQAEIIYVTLKTIVHLAVLYYVGIPLLPTLFTQLLTISMKAGHFSTNSVKITAITASTCLAVGSKIDLTKPQELVMLIGGLLASFAGSYTPAGVSLGVQAGNEVYNRACTSVHALGQLGFFGKHKEDKEFVTKFNSTGPSIYSSLS